MPPDISCGQKRRVRAQEERIGKEEELRRSQDKGREGNRNGGNTLIDFNLKPGRGKCHRKGGREGNEQEIQALGSLQTATSEGQRLLKTFEKETIKVDARSQINTAFFEKHRMGFSKMLKNSISFHFS